MGMDMDDCLLGIYSTNRHLPRKLFRASITYTRKLRKVKVQLVIDKIGARLPGWKGKFLLTSGRETLVKWVLTHLTVFQAQKWLLKRIDRIRRSFLRQGETPENVIGGHSLINWPTTCLPKVKGGLGILDLERFTRALRLR